MSSPREPGPLSWQTILSGVIVAVLGGLAFAFVTGIWNQFSAPNSAPRAAVTAASPSRNSSSAPNATAASSRLVLVPDFASQVSSVRVEFGCVNFLRRENENVPLRICGKAASLDAAWDNQILAAEPDCSTALSDRIIMTLWTENDFQGGEFGYTFGCSP